MSLNTIGSLVGATNATADLIALAVKFFINFRTHANGVNQVYVPTVPFYVIPAAVTGTADQPKITFELVWTEHFTYQTAEYYSPDHEAFSESRGSDNICGYHTSSGSTGKATRIEVVAQFLLMTDDDQVEMMRKWKSREDAARKEALRLKKISQLEEELNKLRSSTLSEN